MGRHLQPSTFWAKRSRCTIARVRAEILTIGDELCRGAVVDTNSTWLAGELWALDVSVAWMTSCRDERVDMEVALRAATGRADLVVCSGGLGPTEDDLTVDVLADMIGVTPAIDEPALAIMRERFEKVGFKLTDNNMRQVQVPAGARVFANSRGLAPGFEVMLNEVPVICMPGVPGELKEIFASAVRARITDLREARGEAIERIARRTYRVFGMGESHVATALEGLAERVPDISLHYRVPLPEVLVLVVARARDKATAEARLAQADGEIRARLGPRMYGVDDDSLAAALGRALSAAGATMATAESCTGGLIGAYMTDVPGSSAYFVGGAITYSNAEKVRQLGVPESVLVEHGAVSRECVEAMARGCRERFGVDYAVAVSGVAGPGGGTPDKPVGTVWLAVAGPAGVSARVRTWPSTRERVRKLAAYWAMSAVMRALAESATGPVASDPGE